MEALSIVKPILTTWNNGQYVEGYSENSTSQLVVSEIGYKLPTQNSKVSRHNHRSLHSKWALLNIHQRGNCHVIQAQKGEGYPELATRCGISGADFTKWNPRKSLYPSLGTGGQHVC